MPQISCQVRKKLLDILACPVPTDQPVHGEGMPKIMQARLEEAACWSSEPNVLTHKPVAVLRRLLGNASPFAVGQERLVSGDGATAMIAPVRQQHIMQVVADRHQPAFVELGLANNQFIVRLLKSYHAIGAEQMNNLPVSYFDGLTARDAWGSPIVFMPRDHPAIGMAAKGWFFLSAGPDRQYTSKQDNIYSYELPGIEAGAPATQKAQP